MKKIHYVLLFLPFPVLAIGIPIAVRAIGDAMANALSAIAPQPRSEKLKSWGDQLLPDDFDAASVELPDAGTFDVAPRAR